jgi:hypothetical protein
VLEILKIVMGIIRQGIFGGFEGKTGPLVGRRVNGKSVISAVSHPTVRKRSADEVNHTLKFTMVTTVLKSFTPLIMIGFAGESNAFGKAISYNFKTLIKGTGPDFTIDYAKLKYSRGKLAGPNTPVAIKMGNAIQLSWLAEEQNQFNRHTDKACFMVYCPAKAMAITAIFKATRVELGADLQLPSDLSTELWQVYMSFTSADSKLSSDTAYLGNI